MSRNRKPDEIKRVTGTLQNYRVNTNQPKPNYGFPTPPKHFSPEQLTAWNQACQLLEGMGVLALEDIFALEELAVCKAELDALRSDLKQNGGYYVSPDSGLEKVRPQVRHEHDKARHFMSLLGKFGLTPESRSRVNAKTGEAGNPFDEI